MSQESDSDTPHEDTVQSTSTSRKRKLEQSLDPPRSIFGRPKKKKKGLKSALNLLKQPREVFSAAAKEIDVARESEKIMRKQEAVRDKKFSENLRLKKVERMEQQTLRGINAEMASLKGKNHGEYARMMDINAAYLVRKQAELNADPDDPKNKERQELLDEVAEEFAEEFKTTPGRDMVRWDDYEEFMPKYGGNIGGERPWETFSRNIRENTS